MDNRFLNLLFFVVICLLTASLIYFTLSVGTVHASTHYNAKTTAYAFGGTGAAGVWMEQYHVANHPPNTICDGQVDPSGIWPWGTQIMMDEDILQHSSNNTLYYRRAFYLYDNGDLNCDKGLYWLDVHMGRYKHDWTYNCYCSGTPNPICAPGTNYVNNCTDAINYGNSWRGYTKY